MNLIDGRLKLKPEEILFINVEKRTLPFRESILLKKNQKISTYSQFQKVFADLKNPSLPDSAKKYLDPVKLVFMDSLSRLFWLLSEHIKASGSRGREFWADYLDESKLLLNNLDIGNRYLVVTSLDDISSDADVIDRKQAMAQGQMRGQIEGYFDIVLHTHFNAMKTDDESYSFYTKTDGKNSAKSPIGMFDKKIIQNDLSLVLGRIHEYYDIANTKLTPPPVLIVGKSGSGKSTSLMYCVNEEIK